MDFVLIQTWIKNKMLFCGGLLWFASLAFLLNSMTAIRFRFLLSEGFWFLHLIEKTYQLRSSSRNLLEGFEWYLKPCTPSRNGIWSYKIRKKKNFSFQKYLSSVYFADLFYIIIYITVTKSLQSLSKNVLIVDAGSL